MYFLLVEIEALIKLLTGKYSREFENIDRVGESPIGYVVEKEVTRKEFVLPEKGFITDILGMSVDEFKNIFLIRNSDLSIGEEEKFYSLVVDK